MHLRSYTVFVMTPPNEHTSEGGRDDRGVPYHAESTLYQVLKCSIIRIKTRTQSIETIKDVRRRNWFGGRLEVAVEAAALVLLCLCH